MGFNKELSKKIALETMGTDSGPADSQGIEIKSPGKMHWFTVKGQTFDELTQITTTQLYDPDGELEEYIILAEDKSRLNGKTIQQVGNPGPTLALIKNPSGPI